ncbi:MAG: hypothetical protein ACRENU_10395 [Gemmatimonadaceae bacterium]
MKVRNRFAICATLLVSAWITGCAMAVATPPALPPAVKSLRAGLEPYTSRELAKKAGYTAVITDCMSNGDEGAMGIHFGKPALIDGSVSELAPEVLIYEPGTNGEMSLVGVEFVIPFAVIPRTAPAPVLFGQTFSANEIFGLWGLHVWTHRTNPRGLFASWNPRVHC